MLDRMRHRPLGQRGDQLVGHGFGDLVEVVEIDHIAFVPVEAGLTRVITPRRVEPLDAALRVDHLQSAADVDLVLDTVCGRTVNGLPNGAGGTSDNVCDPLSGFQYTDNTKANFGKINLKRGHRVIEFALKYYF